MKKASSAVHFVAGSQKNLKVVAIRQKPYRNVEKQETSIRVSVIR